MTQFKPHFLASIVASAAFLFTACSGIPERAHPATDVAVTAPKDTTAAPADNRDVPAAPPTTEASRTMEGTPPASQAAAAAIFPTRKPASAYADLEIVTLLPPDAIPAVDNPQFLPVAEADAVYSPDELVIGISFEGDTRAYSVPFLSNHEIVNDTAGGKKIAVTW